MKNKAVRLYGASDVRLEEFDLPQIGDNELLVKIVCNSICMSDYKAVKLGAEHKRVPNDVANAPIILGHELCGEIVEVGKNYSDKFASGAKFALQPAMNNTMDAAGYSYPYLGGNSRYAIIPQEYIEQGCVLPYAGEAFFAGALAEPISCIIGAAHANYHTKQGDYNHYMGIKQGGNLAALAACGPMGLAFVEYLLNCERRPSLLVVTDIDDARLAYAASLLTVEYAAKQGVELVYLNTGKMGNPVEELRKLGDFDDVFVYAPVTALVEQADAILGKDGCLNFFAGPTDTAFSAKINFYNVHYNATHIAGTSGGNTSDIAEALEMTAAGRLNPSMLVSHIGGLNAAADATLNLPNIPGAKKLIYTDITMPLTAISDFRRLGENNAVFAELADICDKNSGLWSLEAEKYLLSQYE
ncbi:MAG: zinc-binding dehydrogenase [Defluviitaleaceae bacterium]|nr:zinc-binding dehydrogenase [Defluviitaleaceae bacterium]